jgi:hypothetical protein
MGRDKHERARRSGKGKWYIDQYAGMEKYVLESPRYKSLKDGDGLALVYVMLHCYLGKNGYFHLSCRELGESMGVSHNTANKRLHICLSQLCLIFTTSKATHRVISVAGRFPSVRKCPRRWESLMCSARWFFPAQLSSILISMFKKGLFGCFFSASLADPRRRRVLELELHR